MRIFVVKPGDCLETLTSTLASTREQHHAFEFTGKAGEYFRIWIVNLGLTIVTLGIYSAWAKVRTNRYLYGSTKVAGSSFSYLADPVTILKGRIIAFLVLISLSLTSSYYPQIYIGLSIAVFFLMPWVIVRSLMFTARNSSWRNVRFRFTGGYGRAFLNFMLLPMVTFITLGLAFPWVIKRQKAWLAEHHAFGSESFLQTLRAGSFYKIYLAAIGWFIAASILTFLVEYALGPFVAMFLGPLAYLLAYSLVRARTVNLVFNNITLAGNSFESRLEFKRLAFIYLTNALAILFSLGLAIPWAMMRTRRYRALCTTLVAADDLDGFVDASQRDGSALGEEMGDVFDIAVGL